MEADDVVVDVAADLEEGVAAAAVGGHAVGAYPHPALEAEYVLLVLLRLLVDHARVEEFLPQ